MTQPAETTVTLPAVGKVRRRWVIVGVATVAVLVGYAYLARARGKAGQPGYDPATGTPGDAGSAYVNPDPSGPPGPGGGENPNIITTNAQWGTQASLALAGAGWDPQFAALAIGLYLDSQPLNELQWQAVRAARGLIGPPPVDLPLIRQPNAPATGTATGTGTTYGDPKPMPVPRPPRRYVIVHAGDWRATLLSISQHTGAPVLGLMSWNGITSGQTVHVGQKIWIDPPGIYLGTKEIIT